MRKTFAVAALCLAISCPSSYAAVGLDTYADAKGYIDVQKFNCSQLADTYQEDANLLTMWYSGWYNGLAKKHVEVGQGQRGRALSDRILQEQSR
jgi:hypothetical protein